MKDIPNEILEMILDLVPFVELMSTVPLVCKKWKATQQMVCKRKNSSTLYGGSSLSWIMGPGPVTTFANFIVETLRSDGTTAATSPALFHCPYSLHNGGKKFRRLLAQKFPCIKYLNLVQYCMSTREYAWFELLQCWPNLTGFRLITYNTHHATLETWKDILKQLNATLTTNLKELTLLSRYSVLGSLCGTTIPLRAGLLLALESVHLSKGFTGDLTRLTGVKRLSLFHLTGEEWKQQLLSVGDGTAAKITDLTIYPEQNQLLHTDFIKVLCRKFTSLHYLHIVPTLVPLDEVISSLAPLTQLKHFRLWHYQQAVMSAIDSSVLQSLPRLDSVHTVHLYTHLCCHSQLEWVSWVFPQLKWIKFDSFQTFCTECEEAAKANNNYNDKKKSEMRILVPLKKCAQLRRIYLNREHSYYLEILENMILFDELSPDDIPVFE